MENEPSPSHQNHLSQNGSPNSLSAPQHSNQNRNNNFHDPNNPENNSENIDITTQDPMDSTFKPGDKRNFGRGGFRPTGYNTRSKTNLGNEGINKQTGSINHNNGNIGNNVKKKKYQGNG